MDERGKTKFDLRLEEIINQDEKAINSELDGLDGEEDSKTQLPTTVTYDNVPSVFVENDELNKDMVDDYKHARTTLYGLIDRGTVALEGALIIARESEHPRAYEVSSSIMRNLAEMTKDLMSLQESLNPNKGKTIGKQINIQNNNYGHDGDRKEIDSLLDDLED